MNIAQQVLKITIAHRLLHKNLKKHGNYGSIEHVLHNIRAMTINMIEQQSGYDLLVELDGADPYSVPKVVNRQESLRRRGII